MSFFYLLTPTATPDIYPLSLHDALPISPHRPCCPPRHWSRSPLRARPRRSTRDRKSTRLNSSHVAISYAVFCLEKKNAMKKSIQEYLDVELIVYATTPVEDSVKNDILN